MANIVYLLTISSFLRAYLIKKIKLKNNKNNLKAPKS